MICADLNEDVPIVTIVKTTHLTKNHVATRQFKTFTNAKLENGKLHYCSLANEIEAEFDGLRLPASYAIFDFKQNVFGTYI
jgi:hypothetical protein